MRASFFGLGLLLVACGSSVETPKEETTGATTGGQGGAPSTTSATTTSNGSTSGAGGDPATTSSTSSTSGAGGEGAGGADPWAGPVENLKELDLGTVSLNVLKTFPIPDRTLGFTVLVTAPVPTEVIGIATLRPPVGSNVITNFAMAGHQNQAFGNYGWVAAADPQSDSSDAMPVVPGAWKLKLGDDDASINTAHVSVWVRRTEDGQFHGGVMDVNVFVAPGAGVGQNYMGQVLGGMFPYVGLGLGTVSYYALDASHDVINDHAEYQAVLAASAGVGSAPALNLFVVADFSDGEFGGAIGVAGGVPGSAVEHGTHLSGVAYQPSGNAGYDATVLMHEVGHLGGLFHTTEFQITETDPLADTAVCPAATIQSNPDACPDKSNVMFPMAYGATSFTGSQLAVLHGSGLYRGALVQGGPPGPPLPLPPPPGAPQLVALGPDAGAPAPALAIAHAGSGPAIDATPSVAVPAALRTVLQGVWCSRGGDYVGLAVAAAGRDARATLRALARDPATADLVRARALRAHLRAAEDDPRATTDLAAELAAGPLGGRLLRTAALAALARSDPARARVVARRIEAGDGDPVLRSAAARVLSGAR